MARKATIGSISSGTLRTEDLLQAFADELDYLDDLEHKPNCALVSQAYAWIEDKEFWPSWDAIDELETIDDPNVFETQTFDDDVKYVNDHGNVTIYSGNGQVIWDCV